MKLGPSPSPFRSATHVFCVGSPEHGLDGPDRRDLLLLQYCSAHDGFGQTERHARTSSLARSLALSHPLLLLWVLGLGGRSPARPPCRPSLPCRVLGETFASGVLGVGQFSQRRGESGIAVDPSHIHHPILPVRSSPPLRARLLALKGSRHLPCPTRARSQPIARRVRRHPCPNRSRCPSAAITPFALRFYARSDWLQRPKNSYLRPACTTLACSSSVPAVACTMLCALYGLS
jgi:hypothetical protein